MYIYIYIYIYICLDAALCVLLLESGRTFDRPAVHQTKRLQHLFDQKKRCIACVCVVAQYWATECTARTTSGTIGHLQFLIL